MPEDTLDMLQLLAEVSIATVALSGITMVLAVTNLELTDRRAALIGLQLRLAFIVTAFSVFPLLLLHYGLTGRILWISASAIYLSAVVTNLVWSSKNQNWVSQLPTVARRISVFTAISAVVLLLFNLWRAMPWPYLTQLYIGWGCSTLLFLGFIHDVLKSETKSDESNSV